MSHLGEMSFAERIAALRKQKGFTQDALANQLGITFQAVSKWENGASYPDITLLPRLAEIFGCSIDALLGHETPAQESTDVADTPSDAQTQGPAEIAGDAETDSNPASVDPEDQTQAEAAEDTNEKEKAEKVSAYHEAIEQMVADHEALYEENVRSAEAREAENEAYIENDPCGILHDLPWEDDGQLRVALFVGHQYIGKKLNLTEHPQLEKFTFHYEGSKPLAVVSDLSVCCGDVDGSVTAGMDVTCGTVNGTMSAGANAAVNGAISGNANAGGNLQCGAVGGSVNGGGNVTCGNVGGRVIAGGHVSCAGDSAEQGMNDIGNGSLDEVLTHFHSAAQDFSKKMGKMSKSLNKGFKNLSQNGKMPSFNFSWNASDDQDSDAEEYDSRCDTVSDMNMGDGTKFRCEIVEGDVSLGSGSSLKCDTVEGDVAMAENGAVSCDSISGDVTIHGNGNIISESIDGAVSVQELHMGDRTKFECESLEGNVVLGNESKISCENVEGDITLGDSSSIDCENVEGSINVSGNGAISCESVDGTISMQSGAIKAEDIERVAIGVGEITCETIETVLIGAGGSVTIKAEGMPEVKYQG